MAKKQMLRFTVDYYGDTAGQYRDGQVVDVSKTRLTDMDVKNIIAAGNAYEMSDEEIAEFETSPLGAQMWNNGPDPTKNVHEQDVVIQHARGVPVAWPDPREKGPAEASSGRASAGRTKAMKQWEQNPASKGRQVELLPHNVKPTGTPLGVYTSSEEAADKLIKGAKVGGGADVKREVSDNTKIEGQPVLNQTAGDPEFEKSTKSKK